METAITKKRSSLYKKCSYRLKIQEFNISPEFIPSIKAGGDYFLNDGTVLSHIELTRGAQLPRSFAFCSDTKYYEKIIPQIRGIDATVPVLLRRA